MKRSPFMSFVEAIANLATGYVLAVVTQLAVFPWFGLPAHLGDALAIGSIFTLFRPARSYLPRRLFEAVRFKSVRRETPPQTRRQSL